MAKLKADPINQQDLIDYLDGYSDFAFEIRVLKSLIGKGFQCEHGGTYEDSGTRKPRQFDIRATKQPTPKSCLRLAVECKNLKEYYPLLISCLPRRPEEAFHDIAFSLNSTKFAFEKPVGMNLSGFAKSSKCFRIDDKESLYPTGESVGKSCDQVGRTTQNELTGSDSDIYDKWAQALSSASDLTALAVSDGRIRADPGLSVGIVIPIVVVPDNRLWVTSFDNNGVRTHFPQLADRCPYFVGRDYWHRDSNTETYTISHLEFVTFKGLDKFVDDLCGTEENAGCTFANTKMAAIYKSLCRF